MTYWHLCYSHETMLPYVESSGHSSATDCYTNKLDAMERLRRDLGLLAEEIEDKLLEVRQEIHKLKEER